MYCGNKFTPNNLPETTLFRALAAGKTAGRTLPLLASGVIVPKGAKTPEEANMPLLAVPFRPNVYERFYLMNRRILADQMAFLQGTFPATEHGTNEL